MSFPTRRVCPVPANSVHADHFSDLLPHMKASATVTPILPVPSRSRVAEELLRPAATHWFWQLENNSGSSGMAVVAEYEDPSTPHRGWA